MDKRLYLFARIAFILILSFQAFFLAAYPVHYWENYVNIDHFAWVVLFSPALGLWLSCWVCRGRVENQWLIGVLVVWACYCFGFVIFIGVIFGGGEPIENKIDKEQFFGPNNLTLTLCLAPLVLLLLILTGEDSKDYRDMFMKRCSRMTLDIFDAIEMLEVILEENKVSHDVPRSYEVAILIFVCLCLLVSPLQLLEVKKDFSGVHRRVYFGRAVIQIAAINSAFLVLRLVHWLKYGEHASIFILKNITVIVQEGLAVLSVRKWCGFGDDELIDI